MDDLKEYLDSNGGAEMPSVAYLEGVVEQYPWFALGHKLLARVSGSITPQVALMLYIHRCPAFFYKDCTLTKKTECSAVESIESVECIDSVESVESVEVSTPPPTPKIVAETPPPTPVVTAETPPPTPTPVVVAETPPPLIVAEKIVCEVAEMPEVLDVVEVNVEVEVEVEVEGEVEVEVEKIGVVGAKSPESEIIDKFLTCGEHKIVPKGDFTKSVEKEEIESVSTSSEEYITPRLIKSQSRVEFSSEDDDEFLTEELAEIYAKQELYKQSMKIYSRLMLIYPEKSVYFAVILSDIEKRVEKNN